MTAIGIVVVGILAALVSQIAATELVTPTPTLEPLRWSRPGIGYQWRGSVAVESGIPPVTVAKGNVIVGIGAYFVVAPWDELGQAANGQAAVPTARASATRAATATSVPSATPHPSRTPSPAPSLTSTAVSSPALSASSPSAAPITGRVGSLFIAAPPLPTVGSIEASPTPVGTQTPEAAASATCIFGPAWYYRLSDRERWDWSALLLLAAVVAYVAATLAANWVFVAQPLRMALCARVSGLAARLEATAGAPFDQLAASSGTTATVYSLLDEAELQLEDCALHRITDGKDRSTVFERILWNGTRELRALEAMNVAERLLINLSPHTSLIDELTGMRLELQALGPSTEPLQAQIGRVLALEDAGEATARPSVTNALTGLIADAARRGTGPRAEIDRLTAALEQYTNRQADQSLAHLRRLTTEARNLVQKAEGRRFRRSLARHNIGMWPVFGLLLAIAFLNLILGGGILFLLGAVGGLMSRISRRDQLAAVGTLLDGSWVSYFTSPLAGALIAWSGILTIDALSRESLNALGPIFLDVSWQAPCTTTTLAIAFILGWLERFFDRTVDIVAGWTERDSRS